RRWRKIQPIGRPTPRRGPPSSPQHSAFSTRHSVMAGRNLSASSRPSHRSCRRSGCHNEAMRIRFVLLLILAATAARADFREFKDVAKDPRIETALRHAAEATLKEFPKLTADNIALSVVDVTKPDPLARGDYNGDAPFYPASVVKLFFMAETFHQKKESEKDVDRALKEMIRVSDNDATAFIIDTITDTCSGPWLEGRALAKFVEKRRVVNHWLQPMGYDLSAMSKPWSFGPFGSDT